MTIDRIIRTAKELKEKYGNNPIEICRALNILIDYRALSLNACPAFIFHLSNKPIIVIDDKYTNTSKKILCAHELGHALMHTAAKNEFNNNNSIEEYEANLFAVSLLFNEEDFNFDISKMSNYMLKSLLDMNLHLK